MAAPTIPELQAKLDLIEAEITRLVDHCIDRRIHHDDSALTELDKLEEAAWGCKFLRLRLASIEAGDFFDGLAAGVGLAPDLG